MNEPSLIQRVEKNLDHWIDLWGRRKGVAMAVGVGLLVFGSGWLVTVAGGLYSFFEHKTLVETISALESAKADLKDKNTQLTTDNTTLRNENTGLRTANKDLNNIVAPLLSRAAKEFPGEEINSSLKKIIEKFESQDPLKQANASVTATVELTIRSDENVSSHDLALGGVAAFCSGSTGLLVAMGHESEGGQIGGGKVTYRGIFLMPADSTTVGKPIEFLKQAEYVQVEMAMMPENSILERGKVIFVINNSVHIEFSIPAQLANGRKVFVRDLSVGMKALTNKN